MKPCLNIVVGKQQLANEIRSIPKSSKTPTQAANKAVPISMGDQNRLATNGGVNITIKGNVNGDADLTKFGRKIIRSFERGYGRYRGGGAF